jgi:hypothetical protein
MKEGREGGRMKERRKEGIQKMNECKETGKIRKRS